MIKKIFLIAMFTAVAYAGLGLMDNEVEISEIKVVAAAGDTVWNIAEKYYDAKEDRCFDEFVWSIRKDNDLLGGKVLQAGQEIIIRIRKQK